MWTYVIQGIGLGLAAAAQPGPFQTYLISQTLTRGWKRSLPLALTPFISDGPIVALSLFVLSQVPVWFQRFLYFAGGMFILFLAYGAYRALKNLDSNIPPEVGTRQNLLRAALTIMLSPGPYIYWTVVTGPILLRGWREAPLYGIGFLLGFYTMILLGLTTFILIFGIAQRVGSAVSRILLTVSAIALFCFGLYNLWLGVFG